MSGTRFARTGRCRFLICLGILILMLGMVAIFHSSQVQLDETREQRLHCEQQQEALNERLTTLVEQKYHLERNQERERNEQLETKRNLEQKIKDLEEKSQKEQLDQQVRYDKLKQSHSLLQSDLKRLREDSQKSNKQQLDNINSLEKKLQTIRSELQKEKSNKSGELIEWREKYNIAQQENKHLHDLLSSDSQQLHSRIKELEEQLKQCQPTDFENKAKDNSLVVPKPKIMLGNPSTSERSFKHQDSVSEGVYHISVNITNNSKDNKELNGNGLSSEPSNAHIVPKAIKGLNDDEQQQQEKPNRQVPEVEKNQVAPLSAPKNKGKLSSTVTSNSEQQMQVNSIINATPANVRTARGSSTSSSSSPPLALPPNQRKLPENVAPIPNFEDLLQKNNEALKSNDETLKPEENLNHDMKENKASPLKSALNNNYDSGAHEIRDNIGEGDSNIQHDDDVNNFFDNDNEPKDNNKNGNKDLNEEKDDDGGNDDDDGGLGIGADNEAGAILGGAAAGDIAVKRNQQQQLLDDNLKNEIAEDQGKEFGDGLRLEEGALEEEDDDDYSNPARKQAGGQAIRN